MFRWFSLIAVLVAIAGCATPAPAGVATAGVNDALPGELDPTVVEGQMGPFIGFSSPVYSGCEGHAVGVGLVGANYEIPEGAANATVTLEVFDGYASGMRLCVLGLPAGTLSLVGAPPLVIEADLREAEGMTVVALPANEPFGATGLITVRLTVEPRA